MYRIIPPLEAKQSLQTTHLQEVRFNFLWSITATSCYSGLVVGTPATGLLVLSSNPYWCRWAVCRPTLPDMDINVDKYPLFWGKILRGVFFLSLCVWYWSCPLNQNRDRISRSDCICRGGQNHVKNPASRWIYRNNVIGLPPVCKIRPCGLQPMKMLHCRLILQPHSSRLCWETAQP